MGLGRRRVRAGARHEHRRDHTDAGGRRDGREAGPQRPPRARARPARPRLGAILEPPGKGRPRRRPRPRPKRRLAPGTRHPAPGTRHPKRAFTTLGRVPDRRPNDGSRLSLQTLIVASLASLTAAIVTSTFWQRGTPITAAITPVIVALASELYSRPARRITQLSSRASQVGTGLLTQDVRERERVPSGALPPARRRPDALLPPDDPDLGPMRVYRAGADRPAPIRRVHIRVALVTAAIAFAIAAAVLTLPEL